MKWHREVYLRWAGVVLAFAAGCCAGAVEPPHGALLDRKAVIEAAAGVTADAYPNADDVLVDEYIYCEYQADGTSSTWDDEYLKVLTEKGRRGQKTISMHYTLPYGTAEVIRLERIAPDGTVFPVDVAAQSRVMVDPEQMSANIYNPNHKILRVSVPGLEIGDTVHILSCRERIKPRVPDTWSDYYLLEHTRPLKHLVLDIDGPASRPLVNHVLRDAVASTVAFTRAEAGDRVRYRWEAHDVPRMYREPNMPALHTVVQRLLLSTIPDWEAISQWYWNLSKPHLDAVAPGMQPRVDELIAGAATRGEKIERIFRFVSQQIRYMGITTETEAPGYEPHDVSTTFENRYGVCRDKAALLVAMLRMAGLPAYPVLIHVGPRKDEAVPQPYFNHAVVAVARDDGSYRLMDPTDENTRELLPAYLGYKSYLVAHPEGESLRTSPVYPATNNLMRIRTTGALSADGTLQLETDLRFEGINDNAYRGHFARLKPEERKRFFEGKLKTVLAGARLHDLRIRPEDIQNTGEALTVSLAYDIADYPVTGGAHALLPPPWLGGAFGYANVLLGNTGLEERTYPLFTRMTAGVREAFTLTCEDADQAVAAGTNVFAAAGIRYAQRLTASGDTIEGEAEFLIDAVEFSPAEYRDLKQLIKDREYARRGQLILEAAAKEVRDHDIVIETDDVTLVVDDASHWTSVEHVRKRILTYAGKKRHSELKLAYNPAWESVCLVDARVVNPDGSEHRVVDDEQNLMDAPWVGAAPRYSPAKTLVVSLPAVEVGSVIETTVERRAAGVPFFSLARVFGGLEPVDHMSLEVRSPTDLPIVVLERNGVTPSDVAVESGVAVRRWFMSGLRPLKPEDALPPPWSYLPVVLLSAGDWAGYAQDLAGVTAAALADSDDVSRWARELTDGVDDPREKARIIRDAVARRVRPAGPALTALPFAEITPPDRTLADGYGNTTDRALVLHAMLRAVGLASDLVPTAAAGPREASLLPSLVDCPQRHLFDRMLVRVAAGAGAIMLNDTDQYAWPGTAAAEGRPILGPDGTVGTLAVAPGLEARTEEAYRVDVDAGGNALITVTRKYYGTAFGDANRRYAELPPEERRRHFLELVAGIAQAAAARGELRTDFSAYPGERSFTVAVDRYAVRSGRYLYFTLPLGLGDVLGLRADEREGPWYRAEPLVARVQFDVRLPVATRTLQVLPREIDWRGPAGLGTVRQRVTRRTFRGGHAIRIDQHVDLHPAIVRPESYALLLQLQKRLLHPDSRTVMIEVD